MFLLGLHKFMLADSRFYFHGEFEFCASVFAPLFDSDRLRPTYFGFILNDEVEVWSTYFLDQGCYDYIVQWPRVMTK